MRTKGHFSEWKHHLLLVFMLKFSLWWNSVVLPDRSAGPPSAAGLPAPQQLLPSHFFCFVHWTRCPLKKVINHNYLISWQSPSISSKLPFSVSLYPSIPHCPRVLSLFLCCSTSPEINVAVKPFIYLERSWKLKGHREPQLDCDKYGEPGWTFSSGLVPDRFSWCMWEIYVLLLSNKVLFVWGCWIWCSVDVNNESHS